MKVDIYIAVEDRQPKKQDRWSGYIIKSKSSDKAQLVKAVKTFSTTNEAVILTIIEALDRFTRPADITMYMDSSFVAGVASKHPRKDGRIMSDLEIWQENGWRTARKTEVKNKDEWQKLYNKLRVFEQSSGTFAFEELNPEDRMRDRILREIDTAKNREE